MIRLTLLVAALASTMACSRVTNPQGGKVAPGSRGPVMEGFVNPAGLKVPATAVTAAPSNGYWNCSGNRSEHAARCTMR